MSYWLGSSAPSPVTGKDLSKNSYCWHSWDRTAIASHSRHGTNPIHYKVSYYVIKRKWKKEMKCAIFSKPLKGLEPYFILQYKALHFSTSNTLNLQFKYCRKIPIEDAVFQEKRQSHITTSRFVNPTAKGDCGS